MSKVQRAIEAVAAGGIVVVIDDADRENEGDLIMAADAATTESIAFFLRYTSGVICAALPGPDCDRLQLTPMVARNEDQLGTAFTVSVDAADAVTTGISAADRAQTLRVLADRDATPSDLVRPGHVFPLRARAGGVLERRGHTEAAVDLATLAGRSPVGVLSEIVTADRTGMAQKPEILQLAYEHDLPVVTIDEISEYRRAAESGGLIHYSQAPIPTPYGDFVCHVWRAVDGLEHIALVFGDVDATESTLCRIHSECITGDVFGSHRCDCGTQLDDALAAIASEGHGVLVYLRGHEGRGIGIGNKMRAYSLQDVGYDTVDANVALGLPVDGRDYRVAARILDELGVRRVRLITNNPLKCYGLRDHGIEIIEMVSIPSRQTSQNVEYLDTKRHRMGHRITALEVSNG